MGQISGRRHTFKIFMDTDVCSSKWICCFRTPQICMLPLANSDTIKCLGSCQSNRLIKQYVKIFSLCFLYCYWNWAPFGHFYFLISNCFSHPFIHWVEFFFYWFLEVLNISGTLVFSLIYNENIFPDCPTCSLTLLLVCFTVVWNSFPP